MLYFNQSIYIHCHIETPLRPAASQRRRHLAICGRRRCIWRSSPAAGSIRGAITSTAGANRSSPTAPAARASTMSCPAASYHRHRPARRASLAGPQPRPSEILRLRDRQRPAPARRLAGQPDHQRFPRPSRLSLSCSRKTAPAYAARADARPDQDQLIRRFGPIDIKMGPDGAIYIADWYNPIIQHGEVDFRDPRRDVTHGRIWRVTAKNRPQLGQRRPN